MFDDAFAAIVIGAIGAAADGFAVCMVKTTLLGEGGNGEVLTRA